MYEKAAFFSLNWPIRKNSLYGFNSIKIYYSVNRLNEGFKCVFSQLNITIARFYLKKT